MDGNEVEFIISSFEHHAPLKYAEGEKAGFP